MTEGTAKQLQSGVQIVHAIAGRVRLRAIGEEARSTLDAIEKQLRQQTGVSEVRKNPETGSLTVSFDAIALPLPQLLQALQPYGVAEPTALPATAQQSDPFSTWKSAAYWKKQGKSFLPIVAGLLLARGLGLVGWRAILAYMLASSATRQLFEQIEQLDSEKPILLPVASAAKSPAPVALQVPLPLKRENSGDRPSPSEREKWDENCFSPPPPETQTRPKIAYNIVHAMPGRVRFQVPRIAEDPQYARRLQKLIESTVGVTGTRVNATAGSLVIAYDVSVLSPGQMRSRITELIEDAAEAKAATPPPPPPPEIDLSEGGKITAAGGTDSDRPDAPTDAPTEAEAPSHEPAPQPETAAETPDDETASAIPAGETAPALPPDMPAEATTEAVTAIAAAVLQPEISPQPAANTQPIASTTEPEEPVNLWPCLWQTIRSTFQGLRSGQPPMHALIAGLRDAGAIS